MSSAHIGTCTITETHSIYGPTSKTYSEFSNPYTALKALLPDSFLVTTGDTIRSRLTHYMLSSVHIQNHSNVTTVYLYLPHCEKEGFCSEFIAGGEQPPKLLNYSQKYKEGKIKKEWEEDVIGINSKDLVNHIIAVAESVFQQLTPNS